MKKNNLPIAYMDAKTEPYKSELLSQGGKVQVPCLKIQNLDKTTWLYESSDIMAYMDKLQTA